MNKALQNKLQIQWKELFTNAVLSTTGLTTAQVLLSDSDELHKLLHDFHEQCETFAGAVACKGLETRIGQAAFHFFLHSMAENAGFFQPDVKFLPTRRKMLAYLKLLAEMVESAFNLNILVWETQSFYRVTIQGDLNAVDEINSGSSLVVGFLKEFIYWVDGGKAHNVFQVDDLINDNQNCVIQIQKSPLDG